MEAILELANKISGAGFATLLFLILYGNWKEIWTWSRDSDRRAARYEELLAKEREEKEWWRAIALQATGIAEKQGTVAAVLAQRATQTETKK